MDRKINLPVTWSVCGIVEIEAPSIEAAIKQFNASIEHIPLNKAKLNAYIDTAKRITIYQAEGIRDDLVEVVFDKRLKLIANATTAGELKIIMDQPKPHFNGNKFISDPLSVPEEEMILWSMTSLKAPLMHEAFERYFELFKQAFGVDSIDADALTRAAQIRLEVK